MEDEMISLRYVMTVELALGREMMYRKKIEASKKLPQCDLETMLPLQMTSSSQIGLKRKEPSQNFQALLKKKSSSSLQVKRSKGFLCNACQIDFSTISHLKQHSETPSHRSQILAMKTRRENVSTPFRCKLCDSSCSSGAVMEHHLNGMKHAASLQEFENAKQTTNDTFAAYSIL